MLGKQLLIMLNFLYLKYNLYKEKD